MLTVAEAEAKILQLTQPLDPNHDRTMVPLDQSMGRILAADVSGTQDFPYWDNSAMDGYAVRAVDLEHCTPDNPIALDVVMEIPAGHAPTGTIQPGQAARIFTGSMMPDGADMIVIQENTQRQGNQVLVLEKPQPNAWVRTRGEFYKAGTALLKQGTVVNAPEIAILATVQCVQVPVYRRPIVTIFSTGDELIPPDGVLQPGKIIDSNQIALSALLQQTGCEVRSLGIISDDRTVLKQAIASALEQSDVIVSSGGVSVGDYDYVEETLKELGATLHIQAVAVKPGKPLTVATFSGNNQRSILYFGLPGNPVSTAVSFWRFVQPALRKLSGQSHSWEPIVVIATSRLPLKADGKRESYVWGQLWLTAAGTYEFGLAPGSLSSGNLMNLALTNGLAILTCDRPQINAGETVQVMQVNVPFLLRE
jgi:molybdopterin molybdotransferase